MEKNEQQTHGHYFFSIWFLQNLGYNILVTSMCENNEGKHRTIKKKDVSHGK